MRGGTIGRISCSLFKQNTCKSEDFAQNEHQTETVGSSDNYAKSSKLFCGLLLAGQSVALITNGAIITSFVANKFQELKRV